jgi:hypothetical protein
VFPRALFEFEGKRVIYNGEIAHIIPASNNDKTRPDLLVPAEQRSAAFNGMLVCRGCHKVTDEWTVAQCHVLKSSAMVATRIRDGNRVVELDRTFLDCFVTRASATDLSCDFASTNYLRQALQDIVNPSPLLCQLAGYVGSCESDKSPAKAAASTLLVTMSDQWCGSDQLLGDLCQFARRAIDHEREDLFSILEPLTNALTRKGRPEFHRKLLRMTLENDRWAELRLAHDVRYHGNDLVNGWRRHLNDFKFRKGLARADDLPAILEHLRTGELNPEHRRSLELLLLAALKALSEDNDTRLLRHAAINRYPNVTAMM